MARVLLTGATGFIGSAVLARLLRLGHAVVTLGRSAPAASPAVAPPPPPPPPPDPPPPPPRFGGPGAPASILRHREALRGIELVAHLGGAVLRSGASASGGRAGDNRAAGDPAPAMRVNADGTAHLLSILPAGLGGFCYTSTLDVYGPGEPLASPPFGPDTLAAAGGRGSPGPRPAAQPPSTAPLTEAHPPRPATPYAASKLAAEVLLREWSAGAGVPLAILRLSHVYGPGDSSAKAIPSFLAACRRGELPVVRGGADVRDYLYVDDAAAAVIRALELRAAGTFNIAAGRGTSIRELLAAVQAAATVQSAAAGAAAADWQPAVRPPTALVLDVAHARAVLGWQPRIGLAEGLRRTAAALARPSNGLHRP
jgi:nucleoside-diphosphate-sugar epimerase